MNSKPTAQDVEGALKGLHARGAARRQSPQPWRIQVDPEVEASISGVGMDEERRQYAGWLRRRRDPRGELAHLIAASGPAAAQRHIKRHARLLFGEAARRVALRQFTVEVWAFGMADRATIRLDKTTTPERRAFLHCPASRFLTSITFCFNDTKGNAIARVDGIHRCLEEMVALLKEAPCADSLRLLRVKSIDPRGQPPTVLKEKPVPPTEMLRPLWRLVECRLSFDSEL